MPYCFIYIYIFLFVATTIELPGRASLPSPTPPRPPDYQTAFAIANSIASASGGRSLKTGIRPRVSRTQSRDGGGGGGVSRPGSSGAVAGGLTNSGEETKPGEMEDETQVSAV